MYPDIVENEWGLDLKNSFDFFHWKYQQKQNL